MVFYLDLFWICWGLSQQCQLVVISNMLPTYYTAWLYRLMLILVL